GNRAGGAQRHGPGARRIAQSSVWRHSHRGFGRIFDRAAVVNSCRRVRGAGGTESETARSRSGTPTCRRENAMDTRKLVLPAVALVGGALLGRLIGIRGLVRAGMAALTVAHVSRTAGLLTARQAP